VSAMMLNKCPADGCTKKIARELAFCKDHWFALPPATRDEIWKTYRASEWNAWSGVMEDAKQQLKEKGLAG
jgi:hypothetical protein